MSEKLFPNLRKLNQTDITVETDKGIYCKTYRENQGKLKIVCCRIARKRKIQTILLVLHTLLIISNKDIQLTNCPYLILLLEIGKAKLVYSKHAFLHYFDNDPIINQLTNLKTYFENIDDKFVKFNVTNILSFHGLSGALIKRAKYLNQLTQNKLTTFSNTLELIEDSMTE